MTEEAARLPVDILMVGVGGQGIILASRILAHAARAAGYDIKVSEIHGMAQRGGSVVTQVRLGEKVYSPLIPEGEADVILAFEQLEALRWVNYVKNTGTIIVNSQVIYPVPVLAGMSRYPENIPAHLSRRARTIMVDALQKALECGDSRAANVVLLGSLARRMSIPLSYWMNALEACVPARYLEVNRAAFQSGYTL
ncbi:indolepyruvate oxidoreductase subunit beta [Desulfofundulus thermocisternus]|uniref:indolepyruvate oxidoreductase subunit beta n=1 Tax=Desulfofundulus thermocisternus TaxID=42471 RepID=UPI001A0A8E63|nr:indolepyruvate oxidoreductase subunit beta [Desulfofundulus thermocisternus]MBE3586783.1 indolepyruvate oxidoreductase subunit beta [Thermoanaerobacter sp.]MCS5696996.1 indolepyruvate oxidoreductase subunit beta [Desulfofundulus thermocisternus]